MLELRLGLTRLGTFRLHEGLKAFTLLTRGGLPEAQIMLRPLRVAPRSRLQERADAHRAPIKLGHKQTLPFEGVTPHAVLLTSLELHPTALYRAREG